MTHTHTKSWKIIQVYCKNQRCQENKNVSEILNQRIHYITLHYNTILYSIKTVESIKPNWKLFIVECSAHTNLLSILDQLAIKYLTNYVLKYTINHIESLSTSFPQLRIVNSRFRSHNIDWRPNDARHYRFTAHPLGGRILLVET